VSFKGEFSHAASKRVALASANSVDPVNGVGTHSPYVATTEQVKVGATVVAEVTARCGFPLYARVDFVRDDDGDYCVLQVEIVEPYLFLPEGGPAAVAAMVQAFTSG